MTTDNQNIPTIVAENIGASLKETIVRELQIAKNVWQKMSEDEQYQTLERIDKQVKHAVIAAVNTIASRDQPTLQGYIDSIAIKDKIKVTVIVSPSNRFDDLQELYASGATSDCQLIITDTEQYTGSMHLVDVSDLDQPEMLDPDDDLLWCVVVPMRSGESVIPAPSKTIAETFAKRTRELLIVHDEDLAACVYAKPWSDNKAAHARQLKQKCWQRLEDWYEKLESGELQAQVSGLIENKEIEDA